MKPDYLHDDFLLVFDGDSRYPKPAIASRFGSVIPALFSPRGDRRSTPRAAKECGMKGAGEPQDAKCGRSGLRRRPVIDLLESVTHQRGPLAWFPRYAGFLSDLVRPPAG